MTKKNYILLSAFGLVLVVAVVSVIYRASIFTGNKDKIFRLLHYNSLSISKGDSEHINDTALIKKYYDVSGYHIIWTGADSKSEENRKLLIELLNSADNFGLNRKDYHRDYIARYDSLSVFANFDRAQYESENELIFTDAALSYLLAVAYGKEIKVSYNGVKYNIDTALIYNALNRILEGEDWQKELQGMEPTIVQYRSLKRELNRMQQVAGSSKEADTMLVSVAGDYKKAISVKLKAYNLLAGEGVVSDTTLHTALMAFQKMTNLAPTGELDEKTIAALNHPLSKRVEQLKLSLNHWRWTTRIKQPEFVLVNIPAAHLQLVTPDTPEKTISMKVIVGKPVTQTPPFAAYIYRVITYPYWTVPLSIATKEMLPKIIKKVSYLEDNELHVLNTKGEELDPGDIKWKKYSKDNFPFTIRQSTGCDNSLGILKFDINSPYAIYLHDTNLRGLFEKESRFLSHGCVRVEKPTELARYILGKEFDTDLEAHLNQCLKGETPEEIRLKEKLPVLIFYMPADMDEKGVLTYYADIYEIEKKGFSTTNVAAPGEVGLPD